MNDLKEFEELIERSAEKNTFLGAGNPMGKILFIGKECAIEVNECRPALFNLQQAEIEQHIERWKKNIPTGFSQESVVVSEDLIYHRNYDDYNPLYPYKGRRNITFSKKNNGDNNGGANKTWIEYQKLYDAIIEREQKASDIDFFKECFMSELNDATAFYSNNTDKVKRKESLPRRAAMFKTEPFFQSFPIVIVAAARYVDDNIVKLPDIFNVDYIKEKSKIEPKNYVHVHYNKKGDKPKLVIHTRQLSMNVRRELIDEIAKICRKFIKDNNIELKNQ